MPEIMFGKKEGQPAPAKKGIGGLFAKKTQEVGPNISDVLEQVNSVSRRLRIIESRYTDLNRKTQVTEKNMLNERKRFITEIKTINSDVLELKRSLNEVMFKMEIVVSELSNFAGKEDLASLKKYIELWEPVKFVTRNEVEKIIEEKLEEKKIKK